MLSLSNGEILQQLTNHTSNTNAVVSKQTGMTAFSFTSNNSIMITGERMIAL